MPSMPGNGKETQYRILRNAAKCLKCGDEIESMHVHDFVSCSCGTIFVDGGREYLRYGGDPRVFEHRP